MDKWLIKAPKASSALISDSNVASLACEAGPSGSAGSALSRDMCPANSVVGSGMASALLPVDLDSVTKKRRVLYTTNETQKKKKYYC